MWIICEIQRGEVIASYSTTCCVPARNYSQPLVALFRSRLFPSLPGSKARSTTSVPPATRIEQSLSLTEVTAINCSRSSIFFLLREPMLRLRTILKWRVVILPLIPLLGQEPQATPQSAAPAQFAVPDGIRVELRFAQSVWGTESGFPSRPNHAQPGRLGIYLRLPTPTLERGIPFKAHS
jgi:hypothetical protein